MIHPDISLNVDYILDKALESGADAPTLDKLRVKLEAHNGANNPIIDLKASHVSKAIYHLSKDAILSHGIRPNTAPPAQMMLHATEMQTRVMLGQWKYVTEELRHLERLARKAGPCADNLSLVEQREFHVQLDDLLAVADYLEARGNRNGGVRGRASDSSYQALAAACVMTCQRDDCALRDCTETRCRFRGDEQ